MAVSKLTLIVVLVVATAAALVGRADAQIIRSCFVKFCTACSSRNPYLCIGCNSGYQLTGAGNCNSCAANYEQNLDERSFVCIACPAGTSSPGGTGLASECKPISVSTGRRLFADADEDMWA